jgi:hypothetical protein
LFSYGVYSFMDKLLLKLGFLSIRPIYYVVLCGYVTSIM